MVIHLKIIANLFGCALSDLHKYIGKFDKFDREHDFYLIHKVFDSNFEEKIKPIYVTFFENNNLFLK